jgi:hypothetical protein
VPRPRGALPAPRNSGCGVRLRADPACNLGDSSMSAALLVGYSSSGSEDEAEATSSGRSRPGAGGAHR